MHLHRSPMARLIWLSLLPVALALGLAWYIQATDGGVPLEQAYEYVIFPDTKGEPSLDDIRNLPEHSWLPVDPRRHGGASKPESLIRGSLTLRTIWLRHRLPPTEAPQAKIFSIPLLFVQSINFYTQDSPNGTLHLALAGSARDQWYDPHQPSLKVTSSPDQTMTVYVALRPTRGLKTALRIQPESIHQDLENSFRVALGLIRGGSAFLIVFGLALLVSLRNLIYLYSVTFQVFIATTVMLAYGDILDYLPWLAGRPDLYQQFVILASVLAIQFFGLCLVELTRHLAETQKIRSRWIREITVVFILVASLPYIRESLQFAIVVILIAISLLEAALFLTTKPEPSIHLHQIALIGSSFWSAFGLTVAGVTGNFGNSIYIENALIAGQFIVATMLVIDFSRRIRVLHQERLQAVSLLRADALAFQDAKTSVHNPMREHEEFDVTIMFIDIMSFSVIAEKFGGETVFNDLSMRLRLLTDVIESYGGTIDRSLGDGLLCFFTGGEKDHTIRAFLAAVKIHEIIISDAKRINAGKSKRALMPVRIGIHRDRVIIGNVVGSYQIDFTMVGNGVNYASNLEQACGPFQIVVSKEVHDKLTRSDLGMVTFVPIHIAVKHKHQLFHAYRHSPFAHHKGAVNEALNLHYQQLGVLNRERRFSVKDPGSMTLISAHGKHQILDFSLQGFRVHSDVILGQNASFEAELHLMDPVIMGNLRNKHLHTLTLEVRWSHLEDGKIMQGFKVVGANEEQCHFRVAQFLSIVSDLKKTA